RSRKKAPPVKRDQAMSGRPFGQVAAGGDSGEAKALSRLQTLIQTPADRWLRVAPNPSPWRLWPTRQRDPGAASNRLQPARRNCRRVLGRFRDRALLETQRGDRAPR